MSRNRVPNSTIITDRTEVSEELAALGLRREDVLEVGRRIQEVDAMRAAISTGYSHGFIRHGHMLEAFYAQLLSNGLGWTEIKGNPHGLLNLERRLYLQPSRGKFLGDPEREPRRRKKPGSLSAGDSAMEAHMDSLFEEFDGYDPGSKNLAVRGIPSSITAWWMLFETGKTDDGPPDFAAEVVRPVHFDADYAMHKRIIVTRLGDGDNPGPAVDTSNQPDDNNSESFSADIERNVRRKK